MKRQRRGEAAHVQADRDRSDAVGSSDLSPGSNAPNDRRRAWIYVVMLVVLTAAAYAQVGHFDFVSFDDPTYVADNPRMTEGLSRDNVVWALTTDYFSNWHPLTWLSYLLDCELFGVRPGPMHVVNLLFHIANSVLLFWVLRRMTAATESSAVAALLFALHPLHVESVAWISERKDVLSTFFLLLTIAAYQSYVHRPSWRRYVVTALLLLLGLMAKSMLVTTPCLLLLLDYWPLNRFATEASDGPTRTRRAMRLAMEKLPLFGVVALSAVLTYLAQQDGQAIKNNVLPLSARFANACISCATYLAQTFFPRNLAAFYMHPAFSGNDDVIPTGFYLRGALAGCVLLAITAAVFVWGRSRRYLIVGWLWYLGTLVPVIGLVQVGWQGRADRYTYVPLIGVFIMLAWGLPDLLRRVPGRPYILKTASAAAVVACLGLTWVQVGHWQNGVTVFTHAVAVTADNWRAENQLALALSRHERHDEALALGEKLHRRRPSDPELRETLAKCYCNLGLSYDRQERPLEAADAYLKAIEFITPNATVHSNLGHLCFRAGRFAEAATQFLAALDLEPHNVEARANLGVALCQTGRIDEGLHELRRAVEEDGRLLAARVNLGIGLTQAGRIQEAIEQFEVALQIDPTNAAVYEMLSRSRSTTQEQR